MLILGLAFISLKRNIAFRPCCPNEGECACAKPFKLSRPCSDLSRQQHLAACQDFVASGAKEPSIDAAVVAGNCFPLTRTLPPRFPPLIPVRVQRPSS